MKKIWLILFLTIGSGQALALEDARQIAESNVAKWNEVLARGRVDEILAMYADNAMVLQPNGAVSKNSREIRAFWQTMIDKKAGVFSIGIVEAKGEKEGTIVTKTILSDVKTLENAQQIKYNYDGVLYSVLKRQSDGSWKSQVQQWSDKSKI